MAENNNVATNQQPRMNRADKAKAIIEKNPTARVFVQNSMMAGLLLNDLRLLDQIDATIRQNQGFAIDFKDSQEFIEETKKPQKSIQELNDKGIALLKKAKDKQVPRTFNDLRKKLEN